jgi:hypothetical protein
MVQRTAPKERRGADCSTSLQGPRTLKTHRSNAQQASHASNLQSQEPAFVLIIAQMKQHNTPACCADWGEASVCAAWQFFFGAVYGLLSTNFFAASALLFSKGVPVTFDEYVKGALRYHLFD